MRQYTTPEQTAKLIELGLEKPKSISSIQVTGDIITTAEDLIGEPSSVMGGKITANYSIGELIEMLPPIIDEYSSCVISGGGRWSVHYKRLFESRYDTFAKELIDALYAMIVKLKEEGVI